MTRKMVAREADVSERHLAQLEAGEGNVSIVLLRRIAAALNVSLVELFAPEIEQPFEKQVIFWSACRLTAWKKWSFASSATSQRKKAHGGCASH